MSLNSLLAAQRKIRTRLRPAVIIATASSVEIPYERARQGGVVVSNKGRGAATTFVLPPAVVGMKVSAVVQAAQELRLDPSGTQTIALPSSGVQQAAGAYIVADAIGETVDIVCITTGTWDVLNFNGTWTAV